MAEAHYPTYEGELTEAEMSARLSEAKYGGPWDPASMVAAINRASAKNPANAGGGSGGSSGGGNDLEDWLNAQISSNREKWEFQKEQAIERARLAKNADERAEAMFDYQRAQDEINRWTSVAMNLLEGATRLRGPRDYFAYNKYTSGGRDIFQQLSGSEATPAFSAPTGPIEPVGLADVMAAIGMPKMPGSAPPGTVKLPANAGRRALELWDATAHGEGDHYGRYAAALAAEFGLSDTQAQAVVQAGRDYYRNVGTAISASALQRSMEQIAAGQTAAGRAGTTATTSGTILL